MFVKHCQLLGQAWGSPTDVVDGRCVFTFTAGHPTQKSGQQAAVES